MQILKNGTYNLVTGVIKASHAIITIPILIRVMGLEQYGVWSLICSILELFAIAEAGISVSTTVFLSRDIARNDKEGFSETLSTVYLLMLCVATLALLVLWQGASYIVLYVTELNLTQKQTVIAALQIGSMSIWSQLIQQVCIGVEQACQQYKLLNTIDSLQVIILGLGWSVLAIRGRGITDLVVWQVLISLIFLIVHSYSVTRLVRDIFVRVTWNFQKVREIVTFSMVSWLSVLGIILFKKSDRLIVASILGTRHLALYSVIIDSTNIIQAFASRSVQPIVPVIGSLVENAESNTILNQADIINKIKSTFQIHSIVSVSLGTLFILFSTLILNIFVDKQSTQNILFETQIAVIITTICTLGTVGHYLLLSIKIVRIITVIQIFASLISLFLITVGSIQFGLLGAVLGNLGWAVTISLSFIAVGYFGIENRVLLNWIKFPWLFFIMLSLYKILLS
jgi:O-antigen/teichoic acid export membrane protein